MSTYSDSDSLRSERFTRTKNLFNGVWEDDADSDATIDLDDETPFIRIEHDIAVMYYGKYRMYDLELVSGIRTDDRMYTFRGDIVPNHDVVKVYKEITRVLDAKILSFPGTYGCSTNYTGIQDVVCQADDVVPYYYTDESPLRGTVDFDKMLPAGEHEQRRVIIVNVTRDGARLRDQGVIPENSVIYLAGQHTPEQHASFEQRFASHRDYFHNGDSFKNPAHATPSRGRSRSAISADFVQQAKEHIIAFNDVTEEKKCPLKAASDGSDGDWMGTSADRAEEAAVTDVNLDALTEVADPPHLPPVQIGGNGIQKLVVREVNSRSPSKSAPSGGERANIRSECRAESRMAEHGNRCGLDEHITVSQIIPAVAALEHHPLFPPRDTGLEIDGILAGVVEGKTHGHRTMQ